MPRKYNQKMKLLYLLKIMLENSDEENVLSMSKIIDKLSLFGIKAERKSIYDDIECLRLFGYDIICQRGQNVGYYIGNRDFELAELKLLVDSVQSSKFLTKKKSNQLISKLEGLTSKFYGKELQRQVYVADRLKMSNETVYYNVDYLHNAITDNVKIAFKYYEYNLDKKRQLRNSGNEYIVSPYSLTFSDDNYYLIAYYPKNERLTHFRVDRMKNIRFLDEIATSIKQVMNEDFNLGEYLKKTFDMFGGDTEQVSILCSNSLVNAFIDKFGEEVRIKKEDDFNFVATVNVNLSPTFFAWIFTFGGQVKIISPQSVVDNYINIIDRVREKYS
jgi:predicted DNA-binding transcriptional regulator YafY